MKYDILCKIVNKCFIISYYIFPKISIGCAEIKNYNNILITFLFLSEPEKERFSSLFWDQETVCEVNRIIRKALNHT